MWCRRSVRKDIGFCADRRWDAWPPDWRREGDFLLLHKERPVLTNQANQLLRKYCLLDAALPKEKTGQSCRFYTGFPAGSRGESRASSEGNQ